jgi:hypothetical protein
LLHRGYIVLPYYYVEDQRRLQDVRELIACSRCKRVSAPRSAGVDRAARTHANWRLLRTSPELWPRATTAQAASSSVGCARFESPDDRMLPDRQTCRPGAAAVQLAAPRWNSLLYSVTRATRRWLTARISCDRPHRVSRSALRKRMKHAGTIKFVALLALAACSNTVAHSDAEMIENPLPGSEPKADVQLDAFMGRTGGGQVIFRTVANWENLSALAVVSACEIGKTYLVEVDAGSSCASESAIGARIFVLDGIHVDCATGPTVTVDSLSAAKVADWSIYGVKSKSILGHAVTLREASGGGAAGMIAACGIVTGG